MRRERVAIVVRATISRGKQGSRGMRGTPDGLAERRGAKPFVELAWRITAFQATRRRNLRDRRSVACRRCSVARTAKLHLDATRASLLSRRHG
jgi:hypothetical protein